MTNLTSQQIFNNGYTIIDQQALLVNAANIAIPAPAAGNCAAIMLKMNIDLSGGAIIYVGTAAMTVATGYPLLYQNSGAATKQTQEIFIPTSDPTSIYVRSNVGGNSINILYFGYITN